MEDTSTRSFSANQTRNSDRVAKMTLADLVPYNDPWLVHGKFDVSSDITHLTHASVFRPGATVRVVARFSDPAPDEGAPGDGRVIQGFSIKFCTEDGDWDLVGTNSPVFYVSDPEKFSELICSQMPDPETQAQSAEAMWHYLSLMPETLHQLTILYSDRGTPLSPMNMNGYGGHAFSLINRLGERVWVKFHLKTHQGHGSFTQGNRTRQSYKDALIGAISSGNYPRWSLQLQVMTCAEAESAAFNPFDLTKVWPHSEFPLIELGVLELNRNADLAMDEFEELTFRPSNMVPGIEPSPDRMLLARQSVYAHARVVHQGDPHLSRSFDRPIALQRAEVDLQGDGFGESPQALFSDQLDGLSDSTRAQGDHYEQPRALFMLFKPGQKTRLFANIAASMEGVSETVLVRQLELFNKVHPQFGAGVCAALDDLDPLF